MKKGKRSLAVILSLALLFSAFFLPERRTEASDKNMMACWISFLDIEVFLCDLDEEAFSEKVAEMYDRIVFYGMNTVIVHVRAMGDAIYPSAYYPWSVYLSSDRSDPGYDPLAIMTRLAHEKGLRFEAWINPYRLSKDEETTEAFLATQYDEKFSDMMIAYENADGEPCLSLDPSDQRAITLIKDGVTEIVKNYEVDAIHFDDYFYMDGMADDLSVGEKKRYVSAMVSQVYEAIKEEDPDCEFGISPAGNIENAKKQGADVDTWLSTPGYLDYIMPQIYWTDTFVTEEGNVSMFTERCGEWEELNQLDLPMYVGLALYRVGEDSPNDLGWAEASDNLATQWEKAYQMGFDGFSLFRYQWLEMELSSSELANLKRYLLEYPTPTGNPVAFFLNSGKKACISSF